MGGRVASALTAVVVGGLLLVTTRSIQRRAETRPSSIVGLAGADVPHAVDGFVGGFLRRRDVPGLSVCLVRDGRTVYVKGFGVASRATGTPVTEGTLFHTASVSKVFVATAILQLVEAGRLELDTPLVAYLPYFRLASAGADSITIRQLLTHTSGLPDVRDYGWDRPETDDAALERYVRSLRTVRLRAWPGERFRYSNMGYDVLGAVIAAVTGSSFEAYMREHVLSPLGMERSTFLPVKAGARAEPHVGRHRAVSPIYPYHRAHAPSSTLHASAADMCRWLEATIQRGILDGQRILDAASYEEMWAPQVPIGRGVDMGLGWMIVSTATGSWLHHGGRDIGFRSDVWLRPETGAGLAVLSNWSDTPLAELRHALLPAAP